MTTYRIRTVDTRTGEELSGQTALRSAYQAGLAATHHSAVLLGYGHDPAHLAVEAVAVLRRGVTRPLTPAEEAGMVSARDQSIAQLTEEAS